jgi:hypothetical protein
MSLTCRNTRNCGRFFDSVIHLRTLAQPLGQLDRHGQRLNCFRRGAHSMRSQMATTETRRYRGFKIVPMRQWAGWCAEAYTTRADLPFLAQSTLRTLASGKEAAVAEAKLSIDRLLASVDRRH